LGPAWRPESRSRRPPKAGCSGVRVFRHSGIQAFGHWVLGVGSYFYSCFARERGVERESGVETPHSRWKGKAGSRLRTPEGEA
jgi:hypothetical protein